MFSRIATWISRAYHFTASAAGDALLCEMRDLRSARSPELSILDEK
jgi:hypothetical protein